MVVGLVVVALVGLLLGGAGWFRIVRLLLIYGGAFLALMYLFWRMRR